MPTRLVVRNTQAPGDILVLSAALRDLHRAHPGLYETDIWVSKGAEHIYWHNSDITTIHGNRPPPGLKHFVAHYPLIKTSNQQRKHFIWGFPEYLNQKLNTNVKLTEFRPKIVMTQKEIETRPFEDPYWVFLSGGKQDFPAKIWSQTRWQDVIAGTKQDINWVQCGGGSKNHIRHDAKDGIYANMVAKTNCRKFINLIYHSEGVVCAVTFAMHVAAALNKPCVVISGGREPWWWEAYNEENRLANMRIADPSWEPPPDDDFVPHRFLHTIGQLDCCSHHGCWKAKVTGKGSVCKNPVTVDGETIPKCLSMITTEMVIDAIESYKELPARGVSAVEIISSPQYEVVNFDAPDEDRAEALMLAGEDNEWIVWLEEGNELCEGWEDRLPRVTEKPTIIGRVHRTAANSYYPYPGGFIVHSSMLSQADSFTDLFRTTKPTDYHMESGLLKLSTRPVPVA